MTGGGRVWAGPRDDAENFDMAALRDLFNIRAGVDSFAKQNSLDVAFEIPTSQLGLTGNGTPSNANTLGIWISVALPVEDIRGDTVDIQLARAGFPSFEDFFIGEQDRGVYASSTPSEDFSRLAAYALNPVIIRDAEAAQPGLFPPGQPDNEKKFNRVDIFDLMMLKHVPSQNAHSLSIPSWADVLRLDMGVDSAWPNGRPIPGGSTASVLPQNVQDIMLNHLLYQNLAFDFQAGVTNDRDFLGTMPWAPLPWSQY
jgi:hypothetical protein